MITGSKVWKIKELEQRRNSIFPYWWRWCKYRTFVFMHWNRFSVYLFAQLSVGKYSCLNLWNLLSNFEMQLSEKVLLDQMLGFFGNFLSDLSPLQLCKISNYKFRKIWNITKPLNSKNHLNRTHFSVPWTTLNKYFNDLLWTLRGSWIWLQ